MVRGGWRGRLEEEVRGFIVGINIEILPHDQCCQVPIVEDTGLQWTPIQCINLSQSTQHEAEEEEAGRGEGW